MGTMPGHPAPLSLLLLLLLVGGPSLVPGADAGPWDGIVGFLQTVARLQEKRPDPNPIMGEDDDKPLRKIVYAVEEQASGNDVRTNGSVILFDSQRENVPQALNALLPGPAREKRSSGSETAASDEASGRQNGNVLPRPFLIGRKLWYVPLWFSVYLILYILALTVKSVARHKIKYPTLVSEGDLLAKRRNGYAKPGITRRVTNAISNGEQRYQQQWSM